MKKPKLKLVPIMMRDATGRTVEPKVRNIARVRYPSIFGNKVQITPKLDDDLRLGARDAEDKEVFTHAQPLLDTVVREVATEVQEMRLAGTLRPFVEGEPIGAYKKKQPVCISNADVLKYHQRSRQWAREALIALRAKNDQEMERFLRRVR